jgi:riboflavin kinase/FMN adenylyltransferase
VEVYAWKDFISDPPSTDRKGSMTIGVFDGVHKGHRALFSAMELEASAERWIFTFASNPRRTLRPERFPGDLTSLNQKLSIFHRLDIDRVVLIDFSDEFSTLTGKEFLFSIVKRIPIHTIVLGDNFRCGRNGDTSAYDARDMLSSRGIEVIIPPSVTWHSLTVSSTRIRSAIQEGNLTAALEMTERAFTLDVANIPQRSGDGAITIERCNMYQILPPPGEYKVRVHRKGTLPVHSTLLVEEAFLSWPDTSTKPAEDIQFVINEE